MLTSPLYLASPLSLPEWHCMSNILLTFEALPTVTQIELVPDEENSLTETTDALRFHTVLLESSNI